MDVSIDKAIIHVLNKDMDEPVLNDYELELSPDVYGFLEKHIAKSLLDENSRKGMFKRGRNIIKEVSDKIMSEGDYFVDGSKEIAKQLFKAMKTNINIASTDMIICMFHADQKKNVAVLKMDYNTTFNHNVEVVDNRFRISIKRQDTSLPSTSQKIQKCAFIREECEDEEYDLIVLDNQMNAKSGDETVAQFFLETFLDAELVVDDKVRTQIFKKETENWIQKKEKDGEDLGEKILNVLNNIMHEKDEIDLEAVSYEMFGSKQSLREDYVKNLEEKGLDENNFALDKEWVERRLNRIKLKTDNNVEVTLDYSIFNDKDMFEITTNINGTKNIIIKNVKTLIQK